MKKLIMMVGIQGSGKSTWVSKNKGSKKVLSLDTLRESMAGTLEEFYLNESKYKSNVNKEFQRLISFYQNGEEDIIIDNMNISRKRRKAIYEQFKSKGFEVVIVWVHKPLEECIINDSKREGAKRLGRQVITETYKKIDVPRLGVDCDRVLFEGREFNDYQEEINLRIKESHESPYHLETIEEHINMTIENAEGGLAKEVAYFHDLGKSVCKVVDEKDREDKNYYREHVGRYCTYVGHDKVSACYFLSYMATTGNFKEDNWMVLEAIYQHMNAHNGISDKVKERNKLTKEELVLIEQFRKADAMSKVINTDMVKKLEEIRGE